ncbi:MAG: protease inhibitor I9 family protein, partial [Myxococcota bacterium]
MAGAVAASMLTLVGFAGNAEAADARQMYIVQTRGAPAATYQGDEPGFVATKPSAGEKLDPTRDEVRAYLEHLTQQHSSVAAEAGVESVRDYGLTLNGFAARMTEAEALALAERSDVVAVYPN